MRDGAVSFVELAAHDELTRAIEAYRAAIVHEPGWQNPPGAWREAAAALARVLRIDRVLAGSSGGTLLVVPDGPLHGVPLEPLVTGETDEGGPVLLGDRFDLVYLPSASFLALAAPHAGGGALRLFALGDPQAPLPAAPLPGAREEVRRIARAFAADRAEIRLGPRATKDALQAPAAAAADVLHVAARTVTPQERPGATGIALAPDAAGGDGLLRPHEIASLTLRARLVVLSACGTGLGRPVAGEGLHSLARAFLIAGVPAVVTSQWDISDRATAELMERLYRGIAAGEPAPRALARAAAELRRESLPLYAHPYYWAPFIFFGVPPPAA
jgi:CHAT domain-containing protein